MVRALRFTTLAAVALVACDAPIVDPGAPGHVALQVVLSEEVAQRPPDQYRIHIVDGPTRPAPRIVSPGAAEAFDGLLAGGYTIAVEGLSGGEVESYGVTSRQVVAGQTTDVTVTVATFVPTLVSVLPATVAVGANVTARFDAVANATGYTVEWSGGPSPGTAFSTGTQATFSIGAPGTYFVQVRAANRFASRGLSSDVLEVEVRPAIEPLNDYIAFNSVQDGNAEVYVVPSGGGASVRLTDDPADDRHAAISPDGLRVAFSSDRDGVQDVFVMNADGSDPERLTDPASRDLRPAWSPDGNRIAFVSERSGHQQVHVMASDGSGVEQLTFGATAASAPVWSPDGMRIAYQQATGTGSWDVYVMNADGSGAVQVTSSDASEQFPRWAPDGSKLVFTSDQAGQFDLWQIDPEGGRMEQITTGRGVRPWWAPNRQRIAFRRDSDVFTVKPDGSGEQQITFGGQAPLSDAVWGPCLDSSCAATTGQIEVVVNSRGNTSDPDGYTASVAGGPSRTVGANDIVTLVDVVPGNRSVSLEGLFGDCAVTSTNPVSVTVTAGRLTRTPSFEVTCNSTSPPLSDHVAFSANVGGTPQVFLQPGSGGAATQFTTGGGTAAEISPDGRTVAYQTLAATPQVSLRRSDGTGLGNFTCGGQPSWSPDGTEIAYSTLCSGDSDIGVFRVDGTVERAVTQGAGSDLHPRWSPSGEKIVFQSDRGGDWDVYVVNADGTGLVQLTNDPGADRFPSFSPDGAKITWESDRSGWSDVWSMDPDGSGVRRVTDDAAEDGAPSWAPGRERLVVVRNGELFTYKPDGSNALQLTNTGGGAAGATPRWGPCLTGSCQPTTGQIEVTTTASGTGLDANGYRVILAGNFVTTIGVDDAVTLVEVNQGNLAVWLDDVASNCTVSPDILQLVPVAAGRLSQPPPFEVSCEAKADLVPTQLNAPTTLTHGDTDNTATFNVFNDGTLEAPPGWQVQLWISSDQTLDGGDFVAAGGNVVDPVPAGQTVTFGTLPIPDVSSLPAGDYWYILVVDALDDVAESDEANNQLVVPVTIVSPPGHSVMIGHDYFERNADADRIVGNAVFLANTAGDVKVLAYDEHADRGLSGEVVNTDAAISSVAGLLGRTWTKTILRDHSDLDTMLPGHDVLLVYEQELFASQGGDLAAIGASWAASLNDFVAGGGVVIVLEFGSTAWQILDSSGLMSINGTGHVITDDSNAGTVTVNVPSDPLAAGVSSPYAGPNGSRAIQATEGTVVGLSQLGWPVVIHKVH